MRPVEHCYNTNIQHLVSLYICNVFICEYITLVGNEIQQRFETLFSLLLMEKP